MDEAAINYPTHSVEVQNMSFGRAQVKNCTSGAEVEIGTCCQQCCAIKRVFVFLVAELRVFKSRRRHNDEGIAVLSEVDLVILNHYTHF